MLPGVPQLVPAPAPADLVTDHVFRVWVRLPPTSIVVAAPVTFPEPTRHMLPREAIGVVIVMSSIVRQVVVLSWYIRFQAPTEAPEFRP